MSGARYHIKFSHPAKRALGHYVYGLLDPSNGQIFYVGKASSNNRAFDHLKSAVGESKKKARLKEIRAKKLEPQVEILRYGLHSHEDAFEVEAAIIDALGIENLTNEVRGHRINGGRLSAQEIERLHGSRPADMSQMKDKMMLFFINQTFSPSHSEQQIYDNTRQFWHDVSHDTRHSYNKSNRLEYHVALAVVDSVVVRVYSIAAWFPAGTTYSTRTYSGSGRRRRWEFVGTLIDGHPLRGKMLIKSGSAIIANQKGYAYIN